MTSLAACPSVKLIMTAISQHGVQSLRQVPAARVTSSKSLTITLRELELISRPSSYVLLPQYLHQAHRHHHSHLCRHPNSHLLHHSYLHNQHSLVVLGCLTMTFPIMVCAASPLTNPVAWVSVKLVPTAMPQHGFTSAKRVSSSKSLLVTHHIHVLEWIRLCDTIGSFLQPARSWQGGNLPYCDIALGKSLTLSRARGLVSLEHRQIVTNNVPARQPSFTR